MRIRPATPADLDALVAADSSCFGTRAWSETLVTQELAADSRFVVVAESDAILGYASLMEVADVADVQRIAVLPDARRRGVGARLLDMLLMRARLSGCARVLLEVRADSEAAIGLYRSFGFEEIDRRHGYYGAGVDALVLATALS